MPPPTYSIIFDNLDFFVKPHYQSLKKGNLSRHWIHHIAVQDRIPIYQLSNDRPTEDLVEYDVGKSLPTAETKQFQRNESIVLGTRMLTQHLAAFKPLEKAVVNHIPHQYSAEMAERSTDVSTLTKMLPFKLTIQNVLNQFPSAIVQPGKTLILNICLRVMYNPLAC